MKKILKDELKEFDENLEIEIITIRSGILLQIISSGDLNKIEKKALKICTKENQKLSKEESVFPFQIYCYKANENAFIVSACFKSKLKEFTNGIETSFHSPNDAIIMMREIDANAILYEVSLPFNFQFKESNKDFSLIKNSKYKALSVGGFEMQAEIKFPHDHYCEFS